MSSGTKSDEVLYLLPIGLSSHCGDPVTAGLSNHMSDEGLNFGIVFISY